MYKLIILLFACLMANAPYTFALSGDPTFEMDCEDPEFFSSFKKIQCEVSNAAYVPPTAAWS